MSEELEKENKVLARKLKLCEQALQQTSYLRKKYDEARVLLQEANRTLEEKVVERTKKIDEQRSYLQSIINGVESPIMVIKYDYNVEIMNSYLRKNIDYSLVADKEHPKCYEISHRRTTPCDGIAHPCPLRDVLATNRYMTVVHKHYDVSGEKHYVELAASPLFDDAHNCIGIIESARDITEYLAAQDELREQKDILQYQAHHDALTELPNRVLFDDRLKHSIEKAKRDKSKFAVFFIDLDRFKQINDSLGHRVGDRVLQEVSIRINSVIREADTLSRLGGDEFTILTGSLTKYQDASILAQKILDALSGPMYLEKQTLYISTSIGISLFPKDSQDAQNLLKYADAAMYRAKEDGRNNFQFYSAEMTEFASENLALEASLREGLEKGEFVVYYQPQTNGYTGELIGMEALVRWNHPTFGLTLPSKFIPLAEETGLIVPLDMFVMKSAMKQMVDWYAKGFNPKVVSLNLAMKQLQQKDFLKILQSMLQETGCKPEWIELEITETQIMTNPEEAIKVLQQISDMGIKLAVDDFGTGYSSLSYLKRLPIDKLKIDQSFIRDLPNDDEDASITRAVIGLSKSLNLKVIAEGVEIEEQKNFLLDNGCSSIQGYLYAKPMSPADLEEMLKNSR